MNKKDILLAIYAGITAGIIFGLSDSVMLTMLYLCVCVIIDVTLNLIMNEKYHVKN